MGITFSRFGKFSVIISLNVLQIPFAWIFSHSSLPMILRFGFYEVAEFLHISFIGLELFDK
jgi:hypothetical protein